MSLRASRRARSIQPSLIRALRDLATPTSLDLGLGQTDLDVCGPAFDAVRGLLDAGKAPYGPNLGLPALRGAVAGRYGIAADEVMITCGVQEALAVAFFGLVEPGDEVLVPDPGFPAYPNLVRAAGGVPVAYPLIEGTWGLDVEAIEAAITPKTRAILLNTPGNPTGAVFSKGELGRLLDVLARHDIAWISDEIYEDFVYDGEHVSPADFPEHRDSGVRLSGVSKSHHMMGWRVGWLTGPAELIDELKPLHQHLVTSAATFAQVAAAAALERHEEHVAETVEVFRERRALVCEKLSAIEGVELGPVDGAFYLFVGVHKFLKPGERSLDLAKRLLVEQDVVLIPGEGFGPRGDGYLRVAYTRDLDVLERACDRIAFFLSAQAQ